MTIEEARKAAKELSVNRWDRYYYICEDGTGGYTVERSLCKDCVEYVTKNTVRTMQNNNL